MIHFANSWRIALLVLAAAPLGYYVLATIAALRFFRRLRAQILPEFTPRVSILKPVRGVDSGSYKNFASFCCQEYPEYEILFAVNDLSDPAVAMVQRIIADFPKQQIRMIFGPENVGANRKVNSLIRLAAEAQHEILVLSDGDVRVGPRYLREVVAPFAQAETGAVTSFYCGITEDNLGAELEAVGAPSDLFAGVVMAEWLEGMSFTLGASVATTKQWVTKIGGFAALADVLADDYELGFRISKAGGRVLLSRETVWTMYPAQTARGFWLHQLRWARTVRFCRPWSYAGLLFTQGLPWAVLAACVAPAKWIAATYLLAYLVLRSAMAWTVGVWGVRDAVLRRKFWLIPLRDLVHFVVWVASFASNRVIWGGVEYRLRGGRMVPVSDADRTTSSRSQVPR
jgi:ceramide glucosyltransferase